MLNVKLRINKDAGPMNVSVSVSVKYNLLLVLWNKACCWENCIVLKCEEEVVT